jgi:hypothetical protein
MEARTKLLIALGFLGAAILLIEGADRLLQDVKSEVEQNLNAV